MAPTGTASADRIFLGAPEIFACPACGGSLACEDDGHLVCAPGRHRFEIEAGLPLLYWPDDANGEVERVARQVRAFYEQTPFPDYEDLDSPARLRDKAQRSLFAKLLDEQIPHGAKVLEVGCGTGQLSNFLGLTWGRRVFGVDISVNSLRLAQAFKEAHHIEQVALYQMNLFRPIFAAESFEIVICNGVLHHTRDPRRGFSSAARLVKRGGYIVVGLYNRFGRLSTDLRRWIFNLTGDRLTGLDPYLRRADVGARKKRAWFADQYKNPHESKHTMGEVLKWFEAAGLEYVNGIPKPSLLESFSENERLFEPHRRGGAVDRFVAQAAMLLSGGKEGGFFVVIGRKP
jgi:SAM-dependent methyltransferase